MPRDDVHDQTTRRSRKQSHCKDRLASSLFNNDKKETITEMEEGATAAAELTL